MHFATPCSPSKQLFVEVRQIQYKTPQALGIGHVDQVTLAVEGCMLRCNYYGTATAVRECGLEQGYFSLFK